MPAMSDITLSVETCRAVREAVGDRADLLFGTHGQFTPAGAIRLGQAIEPFSPLWFEEPIPPDSVEEMARVARAVRIPVATGERLTTKAEFAAVLRAGAAEILQPALGAPAGSGRPARSRHWPRRITRSWRRISTPGRSNGPPTSISRPRSPTS